MDNSEDDFGNIFALEFIGAVFCDAVNPVEDVEAAVGAKSEEIVGINNGGDGGLAEEEELGEDTDGFEDYGEGPGELGRMVSGGLFGKQERSNVTCEVITALAPLNMRVTTGALMADPPRQYTPRYHAFSLSRVRE